MSIRDKLGWDWRKGGKPSLSAKSVSLSSRHFPPLLEVARSWGVDETELDGMGLPLKKG
jgi:hypothetical protein